MLDWILVATLGFLGSFGHCAGMCGPLTVALALSRKSSPHGWRDIWFHGLLNFGRVFSYAVVGAGIGGLSSVLVAGGQLAGIDSSLRRSIAIVTGCWLIGLGLSHVAPHCLPKLPLLHPLQGKLHDRLGAAMMRLSLSPRWWTPALLGMVWGLIPCGFLYTAQLIAAETSSPWAGAMTMGVFGLATLPVMMGVGVSAGWLSRDRRSQLFRMGGWVTLTIGVLTLLRSSEMVDLTGHAALICLMLVLVARPISGLWPGPLQYRRALGVGAFILAIAHLLHMLDHTFEWNLTALAFMLPTYQVGMWIGGTALLLMTPAALTSFDWMAQTLGGLWRYLHLLAVPALIGAVTHTVLVGSHYLGQPDWAISHQVRAIGLTSLTLGILLIRQPWIWQWPVLGRFYAPPSQPHVRSTRATPDSKLDGVHPGNDDYSQ